MGAPVILITGALTGIGRAAALAFAAKTAQRWLFHGRHAAEGNRRTWNTSFVASALKPLFILADVCHEDDVRNLVEQAVGRFGPRLDVAVNNAGTEGKPGPLTEQTPDGYAGMFDTNVLGTLLSLKHELAASDAAAQVRAASSIFLRTIVGERGAGRQFRALRRKQACGGGRHEIRCSR